MMTNNESRGLSRPYLIVVIALTIILPVLSFSIEHLSKNNLPFSPELIGKWFIFWAVGVRLLMAGLRQIFNPGFTARDIFHINNEESHVIVRELGFANTCAGLVGILSLFFPQWRIVSAFASGLYYGLAAIQHVIKKSAGANETIALISDIFIFLCLAYYVVNVFLI